ncbi:4-hydroxy-tetrahydrodipicolinate synthase [Ramlibacter ginsenosidimutans]|uniref:4-hydroxy-tetrahydrodipicolinate synthase n=1 Tax=Ramlibacter ginsenosidimutans TaxID=502333 RepID=A0A934WKW1_9BURK|nr:4-hydroxy-tetrahydrodipicolinate synthase [Ramlibacter ginsenosidimutans]MBK6004773.1 4-hydroxy-tetrahydrodipicolinate synthase [Ramlibacter ginsenosidimutans]
MPDQITPPRHWGQVLTAMVTPFDAQGALDLDAARTLARWLADHGSDGLVIAATTGEATVLADSERLDLIRAVSEAVTIPVIAGTGSNDTQHSVALTRQAQALGAAGVIAVSPYYSRPPQAGIEEHFRAIARATALPVMLYDVPLRTGRRVAKDVLLRLFREEANIVAFKDATGDAAASAALLAEADFDLYSGDDAWTLPLLAVGAVGVVGTTTHWTGPLFGSMISAVMRGDLVEARAINARLQPSFAYVNNEECVYPMAIKALLPLLGIEAGGCRLPLPRAPANTADRAYAVCAGLGLI